MSATILIVEDEPAIQELIAYNLELEGYRIQRAESAEQARERVRESLPGLIILDWMLAGTSGVDFMRELRAAPRTKDLPIIMLTARAQEQDKLAGLDAGADDYVTKPFSPRELKARVRAVLRRRLPHATDDIVTIGDLELDPAARRVTGAGIPVSLGPTEFKLLHFFMTHPGRVYSRAQLLDHVWGDHVFVEERTIDVHIRRLRKALEPSGHDALIDTVRSAGYRFGGT